MATQDPFNLEPVASYLDTEVGTDNEISAIHTVPWVAIALALALHAVMLVVAWFIIPGAMPGANTVIVEARVSRVALPPPPQQRPEETSEFVYDEVVTHKLVEDQRIPTEDDERTEDPDNSPMKDISENPNPDDSNKVSPHPNPDSSNSSVGLTGGASGGRGKGGLGGMYKKRPGLSGGTPETSDPQLDAALKWLKDHQNAEGHWSATTFGEDSVRKGAEHTYNIDFVNVGEKDGDIGWEATCDVGLTGLSVLAFTGFGLHHKSKGYGDVLRRALIYLRKIQGNDGCFSDKSDDHFIYNHAIATMAIAELYGLSRDAILRPICDRAVAFILKAQNPGLGWRYGVQPGINDSSVTGWMVLTLFTCENSGLLFDNNKCYADAGMWYDQVTIDVNGYLKCGYNSPGSDNARLRSAQNYDSNPSMDAIYVMSMLFMGARDSKDADIQELAGVCVEKGFLPQWEENKIDYYYWYYASQALHQVGGNKWARWDNAISKTLIERQRGFHASDVGKGLISSDVLDEHGSWDPVGAWGVSGGRVYATAINALTLQTTHRHQRVSDDARDEAGDD